MPVRTESAIQTRTMMKVLALALVVSSLSASAIWSGPSAGERTVVRESRRVVIVEYDRQAPSETLPPRHDPDEAKDKLHEAANSQSLPNLGQRVSSPEPEPEAATSTGDVAPTLHSAKGVICDAYGSCKEKLSNILAKSKDQASDKASRAKEETKSAAKDVAGNLSSAAEKAADRAEAMAGAVRGNLSDVLRRARDVASDAAGLVHAEEAARAAGSVAHLLGFAVAYGTGVWVTFASSYVLATALPRQQFGTVQSKMYPVYFRTMACGIGLAAAAQWLGQGMKERAQGFNLLAVLALLLVNMMYLEPKATKVMFERMKMEKEEGRGRDMADVVAAEPVTNAPMATPTSTTHGMAATYAAAAGEREAMKGRTVKLKKRMKKLNTYSSVMNILSLMGLTWHLVHLAGRMQVTC